MTTIIGAFHFVKRRLKMRQSFRIPIVGKIRIICKILTKKSCKKMYYLTPTLPRFLQNFRISAENGFKNA